MIIYKTVVTTVICLLVCMIGKVTENMDKKEKTTAALFAIAFLAAVAGMWI